jgi:hypothetical protein
VLQGYESAGVLDGPSIERRCPTSSRCLRDVGKSALGCPLLVQNWTVEVYPPPYLQCSDLLKSRFWRGSNIAGSSELSSKGLDLGAGMRGLPLRGTPGSTYLLLFMG